MGRMHRNWTVVSILLLSISVLYCLESLPSCNPMLLGTSGLTVLIDDPSAASINPAVGLNGLSTSTSYPYSLSAIRNYEIASIVDHNNSGVIASWQALEETDYKRQDYHFGLRYGNRLLRLGLGYKTLYDEIPGVNSAREEILTSGVRIKLWNTLVDFGKEFCVSSDCDNHVASNTVRFALGHKLNEHSTIGAGFSSSDRQSTEYTFGGKFEVFDNLSALASWSSQPGSFGLGGVFSVGWVNLAYAVKTHPELQWTHSIGLTIMLP